MQHQPTAGDSGDRVALPDPKGPVPVRVISAPVRAAGMSFGAHRFMIAHFLAGSEPVSAGELAERAGAFAHGPDHLEGR